MSNILAEVLFFMNYIRDLLYTVLAIFPLSSLSYKILLDAFGRDSRQPKKFIVEQSDDN